MKKTRLWLIVIFAVMCLATFVAGCAKAAEKYDEFAISNKSELQDLWFEEGEDREVKLHLPSEITMGDVKVVSSNPAAVLVETETEGGSKSFKLKAVGAGIAKITATALDESDSVNITVKKALKEIAITNKGELEKIVNGEERTVKYSVKPDAFDVENIDVEISSSNAGVVTVSGNKIKAVGKGTATLTVKAGKFTDTVEISVIDLSAPAFEAENGVVINGLKGDDIKLPAALSCDGTDLKAHVTAVCPTGVTFNNKTMTVNAAETGNYDITLTVTDPRSESLTASVEITVAVYRKIFSDYNGYGNIDYETYAEGKQYVADEEQVTGFDRWDATFASFDAEPSQTYYAELVINSDSKADWSTFYGMTHSVKGDATRWLTAYMDRGAAVDREPEEGEEQRYYSGARDFRIKDIDIENDTDCWQLHQGNQPRTQILYSYGLNRFRGLDKIESFPCKLATARIGDFFYFFVNDGYVCAVTNKHLAGKDTVPGFFQQSSIKTDIKNISWCTGAEAQTKFNTLTDNGSKLFSEFAPSDWWKNENEASENISHSSDAVLGANYSFDTYTLTGENKGIVSPYIFFDGDFTFEWEYQFASDSPSGNWDRFMSLEVRHLRDENSNWDSNYSNKYAFLFGGMRQNGNDGDICAMVKCFSKDKPNDWDWEHPAMADGGKEWYSNAQKLRYRVTRICSEDESGKPVARYTFTIERTDGTEKSVWTYDDYGLDKWKSPCEPVILMWKNKGVKGTYSNVKWSIPESSLTIGNKDALTQKWTVGEDDRTVVSVIAGSLKGPAQVTSSNPEVISVEGNVLTAVGRGTATITVKIGEFTDTVDITITAKLDSVTITNKEELSAEWLDTSTDGRVVAVAYDPADVYDATNTPYTVVSDDEGVIKVGQDGKTLTAVGAGTATIKIMINDKEWDSVIIKVKSTKTTLAIKGNVTDVYGIEGEEITLPEIIALSPDGEDIISQVQVSCADGKITLDGRFAATATEAGKYTLTYKLSGADDVTLTVNVQRKVFGATAGQNGEITVTYEKGEEYMQEGYEVAYLNGSGMKFAQMNVNAGKVYYAEVTYIADNAGNINLLYGLTHSEKGDEVNRYLTALVNRGAAYGSEENKAGYISDDRILKVKDLDMTADGWTNLDPSTSDTPVLYLYNDGKSRTSDNGSAFPLTLGVMRNGSFFYVFINGEYVMGFNNEYFADKDTVPGIFEMSGVETQVTGVKYLADNEAVAKFNALTANGEQIKLYRPFKENNGWSYGTAMDSTWVDTSCDETNGLSYTVKDQSKGGDNDAMLTTNFLLSGDFTFEYDLEWASDMTIVAESWDYASILDIIDYKQNEVMNYKFGRGNFGWTDGKVCINIKGVSDGVWLTEAGKLKVKLERKGSSFIITVCDAAGTQLMTQTSENCSTAPVIIGWKNKALKATYSNITWSATADNN